MNAANPVSLTLEDLVAEVARHLQSRGLTEPQPDGRVSAVPDARTIRYYATLGLLDRPRVEGRQARYGRRHLLQLLAVKALQGAQLPLAEVQARLYGRSDPELEAIVAAAAATGRAAPATPEPEPPRAVTWREIAIEPGLKLLADETWSLGAPAEAGAGRGRQDPEALMRRVRAALDMLSGRRRGDNGGA